MGFTMLHGAAMAIGSRYSGAYCCLENDRPPFDFREQSGDLALTCPGLRDGR